MRFDVDDGGWLDIEERGPGFFEVVAWEVPGRNGHELGICSESPEFVDLDTNSDHQYCGYSDFGRWRDVTFELPKIHAPSMDAIREALRHVDVYQFDSADV